MNRLFLVFVALIALFAACTPDVVCDKPHIRIGTSCCLDKDSDGICDSDEMAAVGNSSDEFVNDTLFAPPEDLTGADNVILATEANETIETITPETTRTLSITEQYEQLFWLKANKSYYFTSEDPYYGRIWFWGSGDLLKMTAPQYLFVIDNSTRTINATKTETNLYNPMREEDIREHKLNFSDYVWWNTTTDEIGACYVSFHGPAGTYYVKENCIEDNSTNPDGSMTNRQIIWENLTFAKTPVLPMDWLHKFDGQEPLKIQYNRTYIEEDWDVTVQVDYLFFDNHDGTVTKLYIHQGYKLPLRVEILKDSKVIETRRYRGIGINDKDLATFGSTFTEQI